MPSIKDTKRRIGSVKNTQKITKAMKLVSAAKFARANQAVLKAKAYGEAFESMVGKVIQGSEVSSPLLERRPKNKVAVIVIGSDRGLCGGLNSNLIRKVEKWVKSEENDGASFSYYLWGRRTFPLGHDSEVAEKVEKVLEKADYAFASSEASKLMEKFEKEKFDRVYVAYPSFVNAITQRPKVEALLPIVVESNTESVADGEGSQYVLEPSKEQLLDGLLHKNVTLKLFNILLNAVASEHSARMTAMDSATTNADEVIKTLTLQYNRARQAAITKELIEITSGAEAL